MKKSILNKSIKLDLDAFKKSEYCEMYQNSDSFDLDDPNKILYLFKETTRKSDKLYYSSIHIFTKDGEYEIRKKEDLYIIRLHNKNEFFVIKR